MLNILFEDNHLIAVNKQISDLVQGDKTGDVSLDTKIKEYIKKKYNKPGNVFLGVIHRIDRPVSGIVLFARTSKALSRMNKLIRDKEVTKIYWAIIKNKPPKNEEVLEHYLVRNEKQNKSFAHEKEVSGSKYGSLKYKLIGISDNYYLIEIELFTGRHHQIRAQLSKIGCAIKGDLKYNYPRSNKNGGISLHAKEVTFTHPVKNEKITITAPFPNDDIWDKFDML